MAIALDATSQGFADTNTLTISHTIGSGSNRLLVVTFSTETATGPPASISVTYNGVGCTQVRTDQSGASGFVALAGVYYMDETNLPSTGAYDIVISFTAQDTSDEIHGGGISVTGAGQSGAEAQNGVGNATSGATVSTSVTTLTDGAWVFDGTGSGNAVTFSATSPQVERWDQTASSSGGAGSTKSVATAGATTMEWTFDATSNRDALSAAAWPPIPDTAYEITGITKDLAGNALGSCEVYLVKDGGDDTYTFIAHQTSNVSTGAYAFTGLTDNDPNYQVIAWKDDTPHVYDVTDHVITPVEE